MDEESFSAGSSGAPPPPDADMTSYWAGEDQLRARQAAFEAQLYRNRNSAPPYYRPPAGPGPVPPTPDPDRLTAVELLIGAPILVGLGAGVAALLLGWPYLDVALLSAAATFVFGLVARLKGWLLGLALWLALTFLVLHLAGVDVGFVVDPVSRLAHDLARAVDDRLGS
jgi:hypothetical protein